MTKSPSIFLILIALLITSSFALRIRRKLIKEKNTNKYCIFGRCHDEIDDKIDDANNDDDDDLLKIESKNKSSIMN